ncbi:hypothetical protein [Sphingopyxis sp.]|jgi:hypothetical protein|uniref:hypothetical protein n=1 Tax=Sphingopyxis sp. TaxID=1908224 RepID=UPI003F7053E5
MTKARAPLSIDAALARIAGQLTNGFDDMARVAGRQVRTVRNWSDPDTAEQVPVDCAIALDLAYIAAGGSGAPIFEAYALKLELADAAKFGDRHQLLRHAQDVARETGEANAAIIGAAHPAATKTDRARALAEATEAREALNQVIPLLAAEVDQPP